MYHVLYIEYDKDDLLCTMYLYIYIWYALYSEMNNVHYIIL